MPMVEVQQGTPEWLIHRTACVTASRMGAIMLKTQSGKPTAERQKYLMEIVMEVLTGRAAERFVTDAMDWGISTEPLARAAYEDKFDVEAELVGIAVHDTISRFMASPDALLGEDGLVEFKCPTTAVHLGYWLADEIPEAYQWQMLAQMACTGRKWGDFVSFDPRVPKNLQMFVKRLERDEKLIACMEVEVLQFLDDVIKLCEKLQARAK